MTPRAKQITWFICVLATAFIGLGIIISDKLSTDKNKTISTIPYKLEAHPELGDFAITNNILTLTALKGTDLFTEADGLTTTDNTPRVLFQPKADFIFSAKVAANFTSAHDGAALIIYGDQLHWAKLLFNYSKDGKNIVSSMVTKAEGDEAYHSEKADSDLYLKIARKKDVFVFYTSPDGTNWDYIRSFQLKIKHPIKVGFIAQSPLSEKFTATFSDIKFEDATFKDFWQGR